MIALAARLALLDQRREPTAFLCHVLALAAVLAPLMILFGLKTGVIALLTERLERDPSVRQVRILGVGEYSETLLSELRRDPRISFVVPHPHPINADMWFSRAGARGAPLVSGTIMASAAADPVLAFDVEPPGESETVLTAPLARALDAAIGDEIVLLVERFNAAETQTRTLTVTGILPAGRIGSSISLLTPSLTMALDRWKEGYREPGFGDAGRPAPTGGPSYPTFRIYAADLSSVAPLAERLSDLGMRVVTNTAEIERTLILNRTLGIVFTTIAVVGGAGYLLSLGASLWANVARKRYELSVLRLQGLGRKAAMTFPGIQGLSIALAGYCVAVLLYQSAASAMNATLGIGVETAEAQQICRLYPWHFAAAAAASLSLALLAALVAARRVTLIDPAEGIRHA